MDDSTDVPAEEAAVEHGDDCARLAFEPCDCGAEEECSRCGSYFPAPVELHHSEADCEAQRAAEAKAEVADEVMDVVDGLAVPEPRQEVVVADPRDQHGVMVAMDAHEAQTLVERLVDQAQATALARKWVYEIGRGNDVTRGLTGDAVEDVVQQMNWTGKCAIGIVAGSAKFETIEEDEGFGPEPWWVCTVEAVDARTGSIMVGTSSEPKWMKLTDRVAQRYRTQGRPIREDNKIFDRFSRAKALNKAQRNAMEKHIPEVVKQTIIAMAAKKPELVERMRTEVEAKVEAMPPPLVTPEAVALKGELDALYDQIKELGSGQGRIKFPPGQYAGYMFQAQHSLEDLTRFRGYLEDRLEKIPQELELERIDREARKSVWLVKCPKCEAPSKAKCRDDKGKPKRDCPERLPARRAQLEAAVAS